MSDIPKTVKAARRVSTPIIAITTPDPPATIAAIVASFNGNAPPIIQWDIIRGLTALNKPGADVLGDPNVLPASDIPGLVPGQNPTEALTIAGKFPRRTLFFFHNAQRFISDTSVMQAICNVRDDYKSDMRTLALIGPDVPLPLELRQDVLTLDEPLPDDARIDEIVTSTYEQARIAKPALPEMTEDVRRDCKSALAGLASFSAEQNMAMAIDIDRNLLDVQMVWTRKRDTVNQTDGIEMLDDATLPTFADLGGLTAAIDFGVAYFAGRRRPRVVVWLDEIEKMFGGLGTGGGGDSSGTTQDQLGVCLREQEFNNWPGMILAGPPGAGKSHYARALGRSHGVPTIMLDLGAMKGSLVGQSEERIRAAMKVIKAVGGSGGAFFCATCNDLNVLPPELRRRYKFGIWYFDLPDASERAAIWRVCLDKFGLKGDAAARTFSDEGWTGAEIRNVCELAWSLNKPLDEAAKKIVPVSISDPQRIEKLRGLAEGKFLSATYDGPYRRARASAFAAPAARTFAEGD
jgi:hypothetical protein